MTVKSGLESSINNTTDSCSVCGSINIKTIKSKHSKHLMCENENCSLIVQPVN